MVFPLFDDNSDRRTTPYVNYALIAANVVVFVFLQGMGSNEKFTYAFATVPAKIWTGKDFSMPPQEVEEPITHQKVQMPGIPETPIPVYLTLITSMFLHGGLMHIAGNMLFLWIFGDNVEDYLGHVRYAVFYLVTGVLSDLAHVTMTIAYDGDPYIPALGASGAISGVLGGYIMLFPFRRVTVILFRFLTQVPAWVAIGMWFVFQLISGLGALGGGAQAGGGVAYAAHVGGFIAGVILIKPFGFGAEPPGTGAPPREDWRERGY
jgi:membrane associated rhomboid family serine protease